MADNIFIRFLSLRGVGLI